MRGTSQLDRPVKSRRSPALTGVRLGLADSSLFFCSNNVFTFLGWRLLSDSGMNESIRLAQLCTCLLYIQSACTTSTCKQDPVPHPRQQAYPCCLTSAS